MRGEDEVWIKKGYWMSNLLFKKMLQDNGRRQRRKEKKLEHCWTQHRKRKKEKNKHFLDK